MQYRNLVLLMSLGICGLAAGADQSSASASWKHQDIKFNYSGFTSLYTCISLESKVTQVLMHLGARRGVKVSATGCANGPNEPSPQAWVRAEFDTLTPLAAGTPGEAVTASWNQFQLAALRPNFMDSGDCELVETMRPLITQAFALRDLDYRARCLPHQSSSGDYAVRGQVLQANKQ